MEDKGNNVLYWLHNCLCPWWSVHGSFVILDNPWTRQPPPSTMQSQLCNGRKNPNHWRGKASKCGVLTMAGTDLIVSPGQGRVEKFSHSIFSENIWLLLMPTPPNSVVHCVFCSRWRWELWWAWHWPCRTSPAIRSSCNWGRNPSQLSSWIARWGEVWVNKKDRCH